MSIQLSLLVPTYNRERLLAEALERIAAEVQRLPEGRQSQVELAISDNGSTDGTPDVVERFRGRYPWLRVVYNRRAENAGPSANYRAVLEMASGKYAWYLSDDDVLLPGAIVKLFEMFDRYPDVDAYCMNVCAFMDDVRERTPPILSRPEDGRVADKNDALKLISSLMSFISILVFRRESVPLSGYERFVNTMLVTAFMFVDAMAPGRGIAATADAYLAVRSDDHTNPYRFYEVFGTHFSMVMKHAEERGFSREATRAVLSAHLRNHLFRFPIVAFKLRGGVPGVRADYLDGVRRLWKVYGADPFLLFVVYPAMFTPRPVFLGLRAAYRAIKRLRGLAAPRCQAYQ